MSLTTEVSRELMSKFPFDQLVLIFASGLTFVLFFPLDMMGFNLADGLSIQRFSELRTLQPWIVDNYSKLLVQTKYIGDFPIGITLVFLLSVVFGLGIFSLTDAFEFVNGKIMRQAFREEEKKCKKS